jgi:hypothetical protein
LFAKKIFISHDSRCLPEANEFCELVRQFSKGSSPAIFLSSGAESVATGEPWLNAIMNSLGACDHFVALITKREHFNNRWIQFEVGYALARIRPQVFVFGQIPMDPPLPLGGLQLIGTGNTKRVENALSALGVEWNKEAINAFAHLFRQCDGYRGIPPNQIDCPQCRRNHGLGVKGN